MGLPYFDRDSVLMRLNRTICLYNGEPVYVSMEEQPPRRHRIAVGIGPNGRQIEVPVAPEPRNEHLVAIYRLPLTPNSKSQIVDYRETAFSYKSFPLGYININGVATYLSRAPMRQQSQGLTSRCIYRRPYYDIYGNWFTSQEMKDCILGVYPTRDEADALLRQYAARCVAVSRNIAISRDAGDAYGLHYKGRQIGYKDGDKFVLIKSKETEALRMLLRDEKEINQCLC